MITVNPIEDMMLKNNILTNMGVSLTSGDVLVMKDDFEPMGFITIDIDHSVLRMHSIQLMAGTLLPLDETATMCADFLMRAAASYGANRGAYRIENYIELLQDFYVTKGFKMEHGIAVIPTSDIVHICKPKDGC